MYIPKISWRIILYKVTNSNHNHYTIYRYCHIQHILKLNRVDCKCPIRIVLGKDINRLRDSGNVNRRYMLCLKFITNKITIDLNVFGLFMKNMIGGYVKSCLIIPKH